MSWVVLWWVDGSWRSMGHFPLHQLDHQCPLVAPTDAKQVSREVHRAGTLVSLVYILL